LFFSHPGAFLRSQQTIARCQWKVESMWEQRDDIATKIKMGVSRVLLSYDIDSAFVEKLARDVGSYLQASIEEAFKEQPKLATLN